MKTFELVIHVQVEDDRNMHEVSERVEEQLGARVVAVTDLRHGSSVLDDDENDEGSDEPDPSGRYPQPGDPGFDDELADADFRRLDE
jgi:hypothetical protein